MLGFDYEKFNRCSQRQQILGLQKLPICILEKESKININSYSNYYEYLTDFNFIRLKIDKLEKGFELLVKDYDYSTTVFLEDSSFISKNKILKLIKETLLISIIAIGDEYEQYGKQLASQLLGRLKDNKNINIQKLLKQASNYLEENGGLLPISLCLNNPINNYVEILKAHNSRVLALTLVDDTKIVSASEDTNLILWDLTKEQRFISHIPGHKNTILSVEATGDGKTVISSALDKKVLVWDIADVDKNESFPNKQTFEGHNSWTTALAITPDNRQVIFLKDRTTLEVRDIDTGKLNLTLQRPPNHIKDLVYDVVVIENQKQAITCSFDKKIRVWDLSNGKVIKVLEGHKQGVYALALVPQSDLVISASLDSTLKLWNLSTGKEIRTFRGHQSFVLGVTISSDGKHLFSCSADCTIKIWELSTGKVIKTLIGHDEWVRSVAITSDSKKLISCSDDHTVRVWNLEQIIREPISKKDFFIINSSGTKFITVEDKQSSQDNSVIQIWDFKEQKVIKTLKEHTAKINTVQISPNSQYAVSAGRDCTIKIWDFETGKIKHNIVNAHHDWIWALAISPDGEYLASASSDCTIKVWYLSSGELYKEFKGHSKTVRDITFTSDGKNIISGSRDRTLRVWNIDEDKSITCLKQNSGGIMKILVTKDSHFVVSVVNPHLNRKALDNRSQSSDINLPNNPNGRGTRSVNIWDLKKQNLFTTIESRKKEPLFFGTESQSMFTIALTSDDKYLLSAVGDYDITVFNLETKETKILEGHKHLVMDLAVTKDGKKAISASLDRTIRVWDLDTQQEITRFTGDNGFLNFAVMENQNNIVACDRLYKLHFFHWYL